MDYLKFVGLNNSLSPYINRMESRSRSIEATSNLMIVECACGLRHLAGGKLRSLECNFGISKSSAYVAKDIFIDAVLQCTDLDIKFPTTNKEYTAIAQDFESKATVTILQGCVGTIDGFFQPMMKPSIKDSLGNLRASFSGHYRMYGLNV